MLMFLNVKTGELYLGYNYEEGGAAAELPSCHGNIYCLRRNYPMSKKSATQLRSAVWTTVFALLQK